MQQKQEFYETARAIVSFTDSYTQNKQGKRNEQSNQEQTPSLVEISAYLQYLRDQICYNNALNSVIHIPKLLKSLSALVTFRLGTHIDLDVGNQRLKVRSLSRQCLYRIQYIGDEQVHSDLINNGYVRVMSISFSTAGGKGEEQDEEILNGLIRIYDFLIGLHEGKTQQPSFQTLPLLVRNTEEQMEEEGADEELDAQMNNNGFNGRIKSNANDAKAMTLNHFIHRN
ncbi:MAG: hypothetical protein EZS28_043129 [Streblomastix strix]|uniref:Uncharacterized protein n=1 Tax=Streblomastix strix TaxID=222440 RepID=A0A5J4TSP1_9EUKA|nr:MAG: hypothetical protein EZS28_043129 [Streblomastix strix]